MKTIWIDLTDISVWEGHHTGTQRVVYEIAKRYYGQPNVKYFIFYPKQNTFHEYSFADVLEKIQASEQSPAEGGQAAPRQSLARHVAARVYHNSGFLRKRMPPHRRKQIRKVVGKAKRIVRPQRPPMAIPTTPPMHFTNKDTVLIMGKPWDYPSFIETLRKEKATENFKLIQVVYDLIPIFFPHLFGLPLFAPYTRHMFETVSISDGLLAISESTKRDTEKFCQDMLVQAPPIDVIRLGDDFTSVTPAKPPIAALETGNFILCVGTVEIRKNHQLLYTAYKLGMSQGAEMPNLVIVGGKGWYTEDVLFELKHDPQIRDKVFMSRFSDQELEWLYNNCKFTVYPSVYEGWGLPIAESLARGKVCVSSNTSSMTEIAGDLIDYFSPYDSAACLAMIQKYMDDDVRGKKEKDIQKQYKMTTWDQTFEQTKSLVGVAEKDKR